MSPVGREKKLDLVGETIAQDEPQPSAFESLLRQVARAPVEEDISPTEELGPGAMIAGRFEVVREIGRGGFARVFEARDRVLSRSVAIKLLKRRRRLNDADLELFYREARATARLNHPHIVTAYDWGVWKDAPFLVLELLDGEPLQMHVARGPLDEDHAWLIATEVAQALAYAHSLGVLHLDLKSQNVFVLRDGRVKVLDFGLAGLDWDEAVPDRLTRVAGGTPGTMAPEQAEGASTDARADIWTVGVMLYQMLFGRLPEQLAPGAERVPLPAGTSGRAEKVLARTLSRDREARYPNAAALVAALADVSRPGTRRNVAQAVFAASTVAIAVLALAAGAAWRLQKADYFWRNPLANARYERLTDFEGAEHSAAISRDGKFAAFLSSRDGPVGVFVTQIGTGTFRNVTQDHVPQQLVNREIRTLEFSPDDAQLFFWVGETDTSNNRVISTWVVPTLGGESRVALEGVPEIAWSPDGRRLVYHTKAAGDPTFVKAEGAEAQSLYVPPVPEHAHFPTWSPDESFIYFVQGHPPNEMDIWRIRSTGGSPERITFHNSRVSYPTFLDRSTLLYLATGADGSGPWIYGLDVERRVPHRLSSGVEGWTSLAATADGRRLVATSTQIRPSLWRVPLSARPADTSDAKRIPLPTAEGRSPMLAADYLLYVSSDATTERIWKLVEGGTTELWTAPGVRIIGGPAIGPEGDRIAFSIEDRGKTRLVAMNSDGTSVRVVADSMELSGAPVWSPDGQSIVTAAKQGGSPHLFRISLNTREAVRISDDYALDPAWAPRGDFLVYSGMDPGTTFPVKAVTAAGQPYTIPELTLSRGGALGVTQVGARRLRFLPGQATLVVLRGDIQHKDLWAWELKTGSWRQLTNFGRDIVIGDFDVSADGSVVVFERVEERSDVVVIDRAE
jgi:Tol biopolymer transport system component/tRNA A-37 threonylcarbamoyl transferase component Bud32